MVAEVAAVAEDVATEVAAGVPAMPAEVAAAAVGTATDSDAVHAAKKRRHQASPGQPSQCQTPDRSLICF